MKYRNYGRTDIQISELGLGGHREGFDTRDGLDRQARYFLPAKERAEVVGRAIDAGVNYFDATFDCEMVSLGESFSILGVRDGLFVSGMRVDFFSLFLEYGKELYGNDIRKYTRQQIEGRLTDGGFGWLDQFLLGALDFGDPISHKAALEDTIDELIRQREAGKIRFFGFSCHNPDYASELLNLFPIFDAVMVPYNYGNRVAEENLQSAVETQGAAWVAMKALVWEEYGIPVTALRALNPVDGVTAHDPGAPVGRLSLNWILGNSHVTTTVPAMNTIDEIEENSRLGDTVGDEDTEKLEAYLSAMRAGNNIPLAIAGMLCPNLRVRGHGLRTAKARLGIDEPDIDFEDDNAEELAADQVKKVLDALGQNREWAAYTREAVGQSEPSM
jgi:aryl-alcohol dehydrogenase-like predicted oxidoreductase